MSNVYIHEMYIHVYMQVKYTYIYIYMYIYICTSTHIPGFLQADQRNFICSP